MATTTCRESIHIPLLEPVYSFTQSRNFREKINLGTLAFFLLSPLFIFPFSSIGHCSDFHTRQPPRGLQFTLGTPRDPAMFDTIVMANLVRPTELCWLKLGFSLLFAGKRIVSLLN